MATKKGSSGACNIVLDGIEVAIGIGRTVRLHARREDDTGKTAGIGGASSEAKLSSGVVLQNLRRRTVRVVEPLHTDPEMQQHGGGDGTVVGRCEERPR